MITFYQTISLLSLELHHFLLGGLGQVVEGLHDLQYETIADAALGDAPGWCSCLFITRALSLFTLIGERSLEIKRCIVHPFNIIPRC